MSQFRNDDESHDRDTPLERAGRIEFDDRGNAVWQPGRKRRLDNPSLSIAEEEPAPLRQVQHNRIGLKSGYDPYASGVLKGNKKKAEAARKKDLRALSEWIRLKKNMEGRERD